MLELEALFVAQCAFTLRYLNAGKRERRLGARMIEFLTTIPHYVISSCIIRYLIIACMIPLGIVSATIEIGCRKDTTAKIIV